MLGTHVAGCSQPADIAATMDVFEKRPGSCGAYRSGTESDGFGMHTAVGAFETNAATHPGDGIDNQADRQGHRRARFAGSSSGAAIRVPIRYRRTRT